MPNVGKRRAQRNGFTLESGAHHIICQIRWREWFWLTGNAWPPLEVGHWCLLMMQLLRCTGLYDVLFSLITVSDWQSGCLWLAANAFCFFLSLFRVAQPQQKNKGGVWLNGWLCMKINGTDIFNGQNPHFLRFFFSVTCAPPEKKLGSHPIKTIHTEATGKQKKTNWQRDRV